MRSELKLRPLTAGGGGGWEEAPSYLEDLVEAHVLLHYFVFLRVQDGTADQQVEVLTGKTSPHHLTVTSSPSDRNSHVCVCVCVLFTDLPESEDILETELSLKPDQEPTEAEVEEPGVLRL